uniref:Chaperone protein DnaJ n=1 Tax=Prevotella sp. GTC17260 TaxID=3236796 RepID=A0AB33JEV8_9BACT
MKYVFFKDDKTGLKGTWVQCFLFKNGDNMRKEKRMIEIAPECMSPGSRMTDHIESRGHCCPYCQGNGYFWEENRWAECYKKERPIFYKQECPICQGSGKLNAVITVEWKAAE